MKKLKAIAAIAASLAVLGTSGSLVAQAAEEEDWTPVPKLERTSEGPVPGSSCDARGTVRQYVDLVGSYFAIEGIQSTANDGDGVIPLQQTIAESKSRKWTWSASVTVNLTNELKKQYNWEYNREMFWSMGQNIGPYDLNPGEKGTLYWGFIMDEYTSQRVRCGNSGTWESVGKLQTGTAPRERHVEVSIRKI